MEGLSSQFPPSRTSYTSSKSLEETPTKRYAFLEEPLTIDHLEEGSPIPGQLGEYRKAIEFHEIELLVKNKNLFVVKSKVNY